MVKQPSSEQISVTTGFQKTKNKNALGKKQCERERVGVPAKTRQCFCSKKDKRFFLCCTFKNVSKAWVFLPSLFCAALLLMQKEYLKG